MKSKLLDSLKHVPYPGTTAIIKRQNEQQRQIDMLFDIVSKMAAEQTASGNNNDQQEANGGEAVTPLQKIRAGEGKR